MQTRAQKDLILAEKLVSAVGDAYPEGSGERKIYGGLCHSFPIIVRTCGLCQAVAFSEDKKTVSTKDETDRNRAHRFLLEHLSRLLKEIDPQVNETNILEAIRKADAMTYVRYTRRILHSWIYFKRFAVSILKVESARAAEEEQ
jgi:CRISPR-associated protein Cmr5